MFHIFWQPIYIYIMQTETYIVIHRQICFVLSELFSVVRQARFPKLGLKPGWLKWQSKILPLSHEETSASEGNLNGYVSQWCVCFFVLFYIPLNGYRELDSYEEPSIYIYIYIYMYIYIYIYIYIYVCVCVCVWLCVYISLCMTRMRHKVNSCGVLQACV